MEASRPAPSSDDLSEPYFSRRVRLDEAQVLRSTSFERGGLSAGTYRRDTPGLGLTDANPISDLFMAVVSLRNLPAHGGWRDGRFVTVPEMRPGSLACLDFRESWVSDLPHAFHTFHVFVPQRAFDELTTELNAPRITALDCANTSERWDPVMHHLTLALVPFLPKPQEVSALFAEHVFAAMRLHLATTYGGLRPRQHQRRRGLSPQQERRAKELLLDDLKADLGISELAAVCGLSPRHFERAFRLSTGLPPHQWRTLQRVQRARELLGGTATPLKEIALLCGFFDQSHFTKVFSSLVGCTPTAYRRAWQS